MTLVLKEAYLPVPPSAAIPRRFLFAGALLAIVVGIVVGTGLAFYSLHAHHGVARTIAKVLPLPVARVEGKILWYGELSERANALEAIANVPADASMDFALDRAVRVLLVERIAAELGVTVTDEDVAAFVAQDEELTLLKEKGGWSEGAYIRWGVKPYLLAEKTEDAVFLSATYQAHARGRLERLAQKLAEGIPFADIALQYSEGDTAYLGGDLGYVDPTTLPQQLADAARTLEIDAVSDIVETNEAFWLVYLVDRLATEEEPMLRLRVISIKKDLLGEIVTRALVTTDVDVWLQ